MVVGAGLDVAGLVVFTAGLVVSAAGLVAVTADGLVAAAGVEVCAMAEEAANATVRKSARIMFMKPIMAKRLAGSQACGGAWTTAQRLANLAA